MKNLILSAALITVTGFGAAVYADTAATTSGTTAKASSATDPSSHTPIARDGFALVAPAEMTTDVLTGVKVYDSSDGSVGQVTKYIVAGNGQSAGVVVDVGGYIGTGQKLVLLPLTNVDTLRATTGSEMRVYVPMTKDQLVTMPAYGG